MELMKIITSSFQRLQLIALRSDPRAKVTFTQVSIAISSTFFYDGAHHYRCAVGTRIPKIERRHQTD